jgi:hypothetical protein
LTAAAVGIAAAAMAAVLILGDRKPGASAPGPSAAVSGEPAQRVERPATSSAAADEPRRSAGTGDVAAETPAAEAPQPANETPQKDLPALATTDPEAFVAALSDKQSTELYRLLRQKAGDRQRREARYEMATDTRLQFLGFTAPNLTLSDSQKQQILAIKQGYKPQLEALLADNWAKQDEVDRKLQDAQQNVKTMQDQMKFYEQNKELYQEQWALAKDAGEITQALDEQYQLAVRSVLTPEQLKALDDMHVERQGGGVVITRGSSTNVIIGGGGGGPVVIPSIGGSSAGAGK